MTAKTTNVFSRIMDAKTGNFLFNNTEHNTINTIHTTKNISEAIYLEKAIYSFIIFICIPGIAGNGIVIRLLHFQIKRNPFTVYFLNLAVADTGTLLFVFISAIRHLTTEDSLIVIIEGLLCTYCTGQLLLTIISIDRCLAVFFPIWHRCHQPLHLSTVLCAFSWIVSILFCTIHYTLIWVTRLQEFLQYLLILIFTSVCIPIVVVSSLALFIKGYLKSQMKKRGKLLKAILLALFFFLIFSIPPNAIYLNDVISKRKYFNFIPYGYLCACLNSSVNPLIYFLLGRRKERHSRYNLKISLQRVFKEEESKEQSDIQAEVQL